MFMNECNILQLANVTHENVLQKYPGIRYISLCSFMPTLRLAIPTLHIGSMLTQYGALTEECCVH